MRTKKVKVPKRTRKVTPFETKSRKAKAVKKPYKLLPIKKRAYDRKPKVVYTEVDLREAIVKVNEIAKACKALLFTGSGTGGIGRISGWRIEL